MCRISRPTLGLRQDRLAAAPTEQKPEEMFWPARSHDAGLETGGHGSPNSSAALAPYIAEAGSDPFFLYLPLTSPHTPIVPNQDFIGRSGAGLYGDFVCEVDWVVGEIMAALDEQGLADDTLLIFTPATTAPSAAELRLAAATSTCANSATTAWPICAVPSATLGRVATAFPLSPAGLGLRRPERSAISSLCWAIL